MKIKCDFCDKNLNRKASHVAKTKHRFCNKRCYDDWQRSPAYWAGRKPVPPNPKRLCPDCGGSKAHHAKRCQGCHFAMRKMNPISRPKKIIPLEVLQPFLDADIANYKIAKALHVSPRIVQRSLKLFNIERDLRRRPCSEWQKQRISCANKGKKRSAEFCRHMSEFASRRIGSANPFYGKHHTTKTRHKMSLAKAGKAPNWYRGIYNSPVAGEFKYQSSFELRFAKVLDQLGWNWERNHNSFEYLKPDGTRACYTPDFKVELNNQIRYYETKGYFPEIVQSKIKQAQAHVPIIVLTRTLLEMYERLCQIPR